MKCFEYQFIYGPMVAAAKQESGIIQLVKRDQQPQIPLGTRLRIFPNHAYKTAATQDHYRVLRNSDSALRALYCLVSHFSFSARKEPVNDR